MAKNHGSMKSLLDMKRISRAARPQVFLALLFTIANAPSAISQKPDPITRTDSPVVILRSNISSRSGNAARLVLRDSVAWAKVWAEANSNRASVQPLPALPAVEFSREMIIAVFMGLQGLTGSGVSILGVSDSAGVLRIRVALGALGSNCIGGTAVQYPLVIVRVPLSYSIPAFDDRVSITSCKNPLASATPTSEKHRADNGR